MKRKVIGKDLEREQNDSVDGAHPMTAMKNHLLRSKWVIDHKGLNVYHHISFVWMYSHLH